jgi:hypothetical protein
MNTHLFGAGDPGAKAARDARQQAVKVKREREATKDSKTK